MADNIQETEASYPFFETKYDIPLDEDTFIFNQGHTEYLDIHGLITEDNKVNIGKNDKHPYSIVDFGKLITSENYLSDMQNLAPKIVDMLGQELRQTDVEIDKANLSHYRELYANPNTSSDKKDKIRNAIKRNERTIPLDEVLYTHLAKVGHRFITQIESQGIRFDDDQDKHALSETKKDIDRILKKSST
ncbi:hypothetical protein BH10PAT1_BH10PAT1_0020 [soil metagenome]